MNLKDIVIN